MQNTNIFECLTECVCVLLFVKQIVDERVAVPFGALSQPFEKVPTAHNLQPPLKHTFYADITLENNVYIIIYMHI